MALFVPDPDLTTYDDLIEKLGAELAARYAQVELVLVEAAARRIRRILLLEQQGAEAEAAAVHQRALRDAELERAAALTELRRVAQEEVAQLRREGLAAQIIATASQAGQASAAAQLAGIASLAGGAIGSTAATAVSALTFDLASKLEALNSRITRFPDDVYKQVMSQFSPRVILGAQTTRQAQAAAVQDFLAQGIGHINYLRKGGSVHLRMPIGSYAEMVARTSAQRAWEQAGVERMLQSGVNLGTISGSVDACAKCAPWIGTVISLDGKRGAVLVPHASSGAMVTVTIKGTLEDARAAGWGHPNCRDRVVPYLPGLSAPRTVEHDPEAEKERAEQRRLEREIRAAKRDEVAAMNDTDRKRAQRAVRDAQANMRDFTARTGRARKSHREQLAFADGARPTRGMASVVKIRATRTGVDARARRVIDQIDLVHSMPSSFERLTIAPMPVPVAAQMPNLLGVYRGRNSELWLRADSDVIDLTAGHEIGHWLDHRLFGKADAFGSELLPSPAWQAWREAVDASATTQLLQRIRANADDPRVTQDLLDNVGYLLRPAEQFARSYAQWIAMRSGDNRMLDELNTFRDSSPNGTRRTYHWSDDEFEPIADALDGIFREKGLRP